MKLKNEFLQEDVLPGTIEPTAQIASPTPLVGETDECMPDSSMMRHVEYETASSTLSVLFNTGHVYKFQNVPRGVFDGICSAASAGQFFNKQVRDRYPFTRVS